MSETAANAAWNRIILGLTQDGTPPEKGSPGHITADACASSLAAERRFAPLPVDVRGIIGEDAWSSLIDQAHVAASTKFEHYGRSVADVSDEVLSVVRPAALMDLLQSKSGKLSIDVEATFLYYRNGEGLPLHLDNDSTYEYNLLFCIEKSFRNETAVRQSATYFYLGGGVVSAVVLEPGHGVWFHAGFTPHARMPLLSESKITLFSLGMRRDG